MDLVVDHVGELQHVDEPDRDRAVVGLAGAAVEQLDLAVVLHQHAAALAVVVELAEDLLHRRVLGPRRTLLVPMRTVERGGRDPHGRLGARTGLARDAVVGAGGADAGVDVHALPPEPRGVAEVALQHLADVHPARHAERREDDVDSGAVGHEGHVLLGEDLGDDALVAVAARQLVALGDLSLLGDVDAHELVHPRGQLVAVVAAEDLASMTLPSSPWGTLSEVSRTSRAFSPKIARKRRSSGVCSVSPLGVTFPTRTSPARPPRPRG